MLKQCWRLICASQHFQPPSGGCVLKQEENPQIIGPGAPAAFRRLCVETVAPFSFSQSFRPAAFRRLCVETNGVSSAHTGADPAAFRRLCVETRRTCQSWRRFLSSRLQAAVC